MRKHLKPKPTYKLQWGRNFIVAEMLHPYPTYHTNYTLQWGRNFIVAEMITNKPLGPQQPYLLQWGRNFIVAEMRPSSWAT